MQANTQVMQNKAVCLCGILQPLNGVSKLLKVVEKGFMTTGAWKRLTVTTMLVLTMRLGDKLPLTLMRKTRETISIMTGFLRLYLDKVKVAILEHQL